MSECTPRSENSGYAYMELSTSVFLGSGKTEIKQIIRTHLDRLMFSVNEGCCMVENTNAKDGHCKED